MVAIGIVVTLFNYLYLLHVSFIVYPPKEIKRPPTWPSICNNFCSKRMPGMWVMNSKHSEWNSSSKLSSPPFGQKRNHDISSAFVPRLMLPYRSSGAREANQLTDAWPQLMNKTCLDFGSLVPKSLAVVVLEQDLRTRERERVDYLRGPCTPCMVAAELVCWGRQFLLRLWRRVCGSPSRRRRRCVGMTAAGSRRAVEFPSWLRSRWRW